MVSFEDWEFLLMKCSRCGREVKAVHKITGVCFECSPLSSRPYEESVLKNPYELISKLEKRIDKLEKRIREIEGMVVCMGGER